MTQHMLIAGANGVTGRGATAVLEQAGWKVSTLSRAQHGFSQGAHLSADLLSRASLAQHASVLKTVSHLFYAALKPSPDPKLEADENALMFENLIETLLELGAPLKRVIFLQGGKVYGAHLGVYKTPAREDDSRHFPPNLYFRHEDYARSLPARSVAWTALRPDVVIGHSLGSAMNLGNLIGVYGTLCRELGVAMQFSGSEAAYNTLVNICDANMLGKAVLWAAEQEKDGAYNITNGDQFRWKHVWPKLAAWFGLEVGEPQPISLQNRLNEASADIWQQLAVREGLAEQNISQIALGSFGDFIFHVQQDAVFDVTKARQAGFHDMCLRSDDCLIAHLESMVERGLIPKPR